MTSSAADPRALPDAFEALLAVLPWWMRQLVPGHAATLEEICLDRGRPLGFKFTEGFRTFDRVITQDDLEQVMVEVGMARSDGRTGIDGTLHRVAAITNRYGALTGYTIRIGRHLEGIAEPLRALLLEPRTSLAIFGPPGSGKTTLIRDATRLLAEAVGPRLCLVDASNEIAGDGDVPHPLLRAGRRLQVPGPEALAARLIEGLVNHGPSVMVVDELARAEEARNAIRIVRRGVRVIACLHGDTPHEVVRNPDYAPLLGIRNGVRAEPVVFGRALELRERGAFHLHADLAATVDTVLAGETPTRQRIAAGTPAPKGVIDAEAPCPVDVP